MLEKIYNHKNILIRNLPIIIAFIIPVFVLIGIFIGREVFPFGEEMYLRSDMYHQYAPFLKEFQRILQGNGNPLYTWNIGLGSDFISTYAYYLASPSNWLTVLLPSNHIPEIMSCFIILKAGGMSAAFAFYVQKHFGKRNFISAVFGIFYGLSSYMAAYSWNLMWIDCLLLLPLIVLGLERLVKEGRVMMYTITLAIAIFSNYYIAIMICIFLVLYYVYLLICEPGERCRSDSFLRKTGRFAAYSVLAALMAGACVIPAWVMLSATASGNFNFPKSLTVYYNILEMLAKGTMNVEATVLKGYVPNVYCGISMFMIVPLYWLSGKVDIKEKLGKTVLMLIFIISFALNIPTYIWHGFHFPNSLSSRQSFIYIFLLLVVGYEIMTKLESVKYALLAGCFVAGAAAIFALQTLYPSDTFTLLNAMISVGFLALYAIWIAIFKMGRVAPLLMIIIILVIATTEAAINTESTGYTTTNRTNYVRDNEDISDLLESIETDDQFYRVEKVARRTKNDGTWSDYYSASEFSSTTQGKISDFYRNFGLQSSTNSFSYYGHTPLTSALLGVKYELSGKEESDPLMTLYGQSGDTYLYENKYALPLGFGVNSDIKPKTRMDSENPFNTQNSFVRAACGMNELFHVASSQNGSLISFFAHDEGRQFIFVKNKMSGIKVQIYRDEEQISENTYSNLENPIIVDLGDVMPGDEIQISSNDEDVSTFSVIPAIMAYDDLANVMEALGRNPYVVSEFNSTYIKGTITVDSDKVMFTTIPYSKGWAVYVDGEKTEAGAGAYYDAFMLIRIPQGTHTVEFRYHSPCLGASVLISIFAILLFISLGLIRRKRRKALISVENARSKAEADSIYNEVFAAK